MCPISNFLKTVQCSIAGMHTHATHIYTLMAKAERRVAKQKARGGLTIFSVKPG